MYLCYVDESGVPEIPGNTSHFVLAALSIPIWHWKQCNQEIETIKRRYQLENNEIHVAFMLRRYVEQSKISNFESLSYDQRRYEVRRLRSMEILRLQKNNDSKQLKQVKKNYRFSDDYIHLSYEERLSVIRAIANQISSWRFARLFAECIDKIHFDPIRNKRTVAEQSFEQVVSRFEQYLLITQRECEYANYGILIHDNNETVAKKHTELMKSFHEKGTLWTTVNHIIETPLFVDSQLTSMIQLADICAYSLRRYLENNETELFNLIFTRADRRDNRVVGIRHFTNGDCRCVICQNHRNPPLQPMLETH